MVIRRSTNIKQYLNTINATFFSRSTLAVNGGLMKRAPPPVTRGLTVRQSTYENTTIDANNVHNSIAQKVVIK